MSYWERWRMRMGEAIQRAIEEGREAGLEGNKLRAHIRTETSPGYEPAWAYKLWLSEVRMQLGIDPPKTRMRIKRTPPSRGQLNLPIPDLFERPSKPDAIGPTGISSQPASRTSAR